MSSDNLEIVEEYDHGCSIVSERVPGEVSRYHYQGPLGRVKTFHSLEKARLFADVQTVTGGFREEKTGERGVPPAVARAREDTLMAYLVSNPTMGMEWVQRFYNDVEEDVVRGYVQNVQSRAEELRKANE